MTPPNYVNWLDWDSNKLNKNKSEGTSKEETKNLNDSDSWDDYFNLISLRYEGLQDILFSDDNEQKIISSDLPINENEILEEYDDNLTKKLEEKKVFLKEESANFLFSRNNTNVAKCALGHCCEPNHALKNDFIEEMEETIYELTSNSVSLNKLKSELEVKELTKASPVKSISVLKPQTKIHGLCKAVCPQRNQIEKSDQKSFKFLQNPRKSSRPTVRVKHLESDGDSPPDSSRSESPQSNSGDERISLQQIEASLSYIAAVAKTCMKNRAGESNDQLVRRPRFVQKKDNPQVLMDSDIRRNTLNDHSYTLNESSSQRSMIDFTSESGKRK